ncbi:DUF4118 domain-containing protein, partial [Dactylosporangium sp. NPDC050688]|uniref:DUF4118 domain-containing protein n=1 Tax=Dactylosporangium sp. NPDC050688 TaxID=3157217 RepID=UPI003400D901
TLGGTYHQVVGNDIPAALLDFARGVNATQLVLGASRRNRFAQILSPGVGVTTTAESGTIDVHLVTHEQARRGRLRLGPTGGLTPRRRLAGVALAGLGLPLLTAGLSAVQADISLPSDILAFLMLTVAVALLGGLWPALLAAVGSFLLLNFYFTPPVHRFTVAERENLFALLAFVAVAGAVATVVDLAARRTREAARARAEAQTLSTLAGSVLHGDRPLPALLERVRETFALASVTLLQRRTDEDGAPGGWRIAANVGGPPCTAPADGQTEVPIDEDLRLVLRGPTLAAADRRLVEAFAAHAAIALRQQRLAEQASTAGTLAEVDRLRTALLSAVSHDLRTPLASAKAAVGSLRSHDVEFSAEDREELLATAEESLDRLNRLVENLLDMSRLQAGALGMRAQPISAGEAISRSIDDLGAAAADVRVTLPADLPDVYADPVLLERILGNVLANAVRHSPAGQPPLVSASEHAGLVEVRVVDQGPGVAAADRDRIFQPFQRLGDRDNTTGVGLGLALSRGLAEAMGGRLEPEHTPGGGLTMTLTLRTAPSGPADPALLRRLDGVPRTHGTTEGST